MRYALLMNFTVSLTPHLEEFLRQQLAEGRFNSEDEAIAAALRLLESQSPHQDRAFQATNEIDKAASATKEGGSRNLRGILSDIRTDVSAEDFLEARRETWGGFFADKA
jgi:putative addiction module CopG family antidote